MKENSIISRFYLELFLRTFSATSFFDLLSDPNFLLDILSILPTILSQLLYRYYLTEKVPESQLFDYFTCLKLFRLFRFNRHSKSFEILLKIFYIHFKDVIRLTILILFGLFYFGLLQFILEQISLQNEIQNLGEALWHVKISSSSSKKKKKQHFVCRVLR